ncbi:MAG: capsular biosynthesis protein [Fusobacteriia bacterium 4572_132]|nr:MAG: capsular biosynthesis protein [Fusobacteriia bacterium 4572_132]
MKKIDFSPPDITEEEINEVVDTLKSGWITTGPKTKKFEKELAEYCGTSRAIGINSATMALEMVLRLFGIGEGDEVITTAYTYTASASAIVHVGAKPILVDTKKGEFNIDPKKIEEKINSRTKAIIPVDIAGVPADYDEIYKVILEKKNMFDPKKDTMQEILGRILLLSDSAHSIGAKYKGEMVGSIADFSVFSFHAVKNINMAEGGAILFNSISDIKSDKIYKKLKMLSLHGQTKDAFSKNRIGGWKYSIDFLGYKCNMTDINASLGLVQLQRYKNELLQKRKMIFKRYIENLKDEEQLILPILENKKIENSCHLFLLRIKGIDEYRRDKIIEEMSKKGIATNVHYIPLPLHPAYKNLGYNIIDFPNAYEMYKNEISLPIYTKLTLEEVDYISIKLKKILKNDLTVMKN